MTEIDLVWLAGLIEGEGSFVHGPPSAPNSPQISLQMTDYDVVAKAAALMQTGIYKVKVQKAHYKQSYKICVRGSRAITLMKQLLPHMGVRRTARINDIQSKYVSKKEFPPFSSMIAAYETLGSFRKVSKAFNISTQYVINKIGPMVKRN